MTVWRLIAGTLAVTALLTGCTRSADHPAARTSPTAAGAPADEARRAHGADSRGAGSRAGAPRTAAPAHSGAPEATGRRARAPQPAYRRWGLTAPLARPPHPVDRPRPQGAHGAGPVVVERVRTRDRVVFLTYDDGAERDPRFVDLVRELRLPVSLFLTDTVAGPGYAHFARLRAVGASVQNHTLDHTYLRGLPYAGQRAAICGQQDKLRARFGVRPRLFRPPYGAYDTTTLRAAADCGVTAVVRWGATVTDTEAPAGLAPGMIVSLPADEPTAAPLRERTVAVLREIQRAGLTVGRLEDYL
ncbi:polysaccharide deacetylase family protein [Streptomyces sp. NPDC053367]|uniref:polysaccharide deacetylase family protein n=1 Tax=Streptomyces sp. NPDC053367 TaxID=3365700 RepID=UPI0037CE17FD